MNPSMTRAGAGFGLLLVLAVLPPAAWSNPFQPAVESDFWKQTRVGLVSAGQLTTSRWILVEGMTSPDLDAAEYLADAVRKGQAVKFQGALLVRRGGPATGWRVRELSMRALCTDGRLERQGSDGSWQAYQGRGPQDKKVAWICSLSP